MDEKAPAYTRTSYREIKELVAGIPAQNRTGAFDAVIHTLAAHLEVNAEDLSSEIQKRFVRKAQKTGSAHVNIDGVWTIVGVGNAPGQKSQITIVVRRLREGRRPEYDLHIEFRPVEHLNVARQKQELKCTFIVRGLSDETRRHLRNTLPDEPYYVEEVPSRDVS